jgi:hypothetical protein
MKSGSQKRHQEKGNNEQVGYVQGPVLGRCLQGCSRWATFRQLKGEKEERNLQMEMQNGKTMVFEQF